MAYQRSVALVLGILGPALAGGACSGGGGETAVVERNVGVAMRDGTVLRANVWRPSGSGRFPVLVYRTPYGKDAAEEEYETHRKAVARGYAVVLQDVRGRYASEGEFEPYRNEGRDGFDTIEWAAVQPWSNGAVGTFGLSYPGAVQWLAAIESPPHLEAMVPAMTFSTPRNFFYSGGVFDASWIPWIYTSIAPDIRRRKALAGPQTGEEAAREWQQLGDDLLGRLPLSELAELADVAPFYFEWLRHPPTDSWWDWSEIRGKYNLVDAAVLNLSGWYDEAYGPEGAVTNFSGLVDSRAEERDRRTQLVIGPWIHGVHATTRTTTGDRDFGAAAAIDYDELVLSWMDRWLKGEVGTVDAQKPVRLFVMGDNVWRHEDRWPLAAAEPMNLYLAGAAEGLSRGRLQLEPEPQDAPASIIESDPSRPVSDPYRVFGPHDYRELADQPGVLVFETEPLDRDLEVTGPITADIFFSCDCADTDLWVKLLDVAPDGSAFNLMSPGLDVQRASYREPDRGRQLLESDRVYELTFDRLMTSNLFRRGHRIRVQISTAFAPHFSRNLHTGELETESARMQQARILIHHDAASPSRLTLPVVRRPSL